MYTKKQIQGLPAYAPGKPIEDVKREYNLETVVKMASNENPYGASSAVAKAISAVAGETALYPDGYGTELRQALAAKHGVDEKQIILGNGSDEVIQFLCRAYLTSETNTVMATPSFSQYKLNATIEGTTIIEVPVKDDGSHDLDKMLREINENTRIVWVCNPNNPNGVAIDSDSFVAFLEKVPNDCLVVSDEAYFEYVEGEDFPDSVALMKQIPQLIVLRTFSKAYGLAGLRIGYGIAQETIVQAIDPVRPPFNNNVIGHTAALAALADEEFIKSCRERNGVEKARLRNFFEELGMFVYPSETNFLMIETGIPGNQLFQAFLEKGFILRSGEALGYPTGIRISIGSATENDAFLKVAPGIIEQFSSKQA
ncbi:histidinol-phosphate transaminase [Shouchella patagoniensis]|uniref:histidinol-phosphate transaminase n=1 Tax=Shouchella patagoniensis TaxID=228576 RepID=UPI000994E9B9|nr:histidinol-phosphate transaminase [Shouchella patagoniensis]